MSKGSRLNESAIDLHRAMMTEGVHLNPKIGRDAELQRRIAKRLGIDYRSFSRELESSKLSAEDYLRALLVELQPFSLMYRQIWNYLSRYAAPRSTDSLRVKFRIGADDVAIELDAFREHLYKLMSLTASVTSWPLNLFFDFYGVFPVDRSSADYQRYHIGQPYELPLVRGETEADRLARRISRLLQSLVDYANETIHGGEEEEWSLENFIGSDDVSDRKQNPRELAYQLTDHIPQWNQITANWDTVDDAVKQQAVQFFSEHIEPKLRHHALNLQQITKIATDVLSLPYWKLRWQVYEAWCTVHALIALEAYRPKLFIKDDVIELAGYREGVVATFPGARELVAVAQPTIVLPTPIGKKNNIKPDLCISEKGNESSPFVIIEYKQRKTLTQTHVNSVTKRYTSVLLDDGGMLLLNYDAASDISVGVPAVFLDNVNPVTEAQVASYHESLRKLFRDQGIRPPLQSVALLDTSGSMQYHYDGDSVKRALARLLAVPGIRVFCFNEGLISGADAQDVKNLHIGGGTNLAAALDELFCRSILPDRLLIVTDGEYGYAGRQLARINAYRQCLPQAMGPEFDWVAGEDMYGPQMSASAEHVPQLNQKD